MPKFVWQAKTRTGAPQKGVTDAPDAASVEAQLRKAGMQGITVKEESIGFKLPSFGGGKIDTKDLVVFTRQFATMIDSGLPLVQCLDILSSQQEKPAFKEILLKVKESVESGSTLPMPWPNIPRHLTHCT